MQEENVKATAEEIKEEETVSAEAQAGAEEVKEEAGEVDPKDAKIAELEAKAEELQNKLLRSMADFQNFKRRTTEEKEQLSSFVTSNVVGKFLKVLDNFERAEQAAKKASDLESMLKGMEQIRKQFENALTELKVEEIAAQGVKLDPNLHEALMTGQNPELEDDTIDMVFEKGYKLGDKVIRHSKVRVVKN